MNVDFESLKIGFISMIIGLLIIPLKFDQQQKIRLLNNKFHGLSPSGGHHSLLFDRGLPTNAKLQHHLADRNTI